MPTLVWGATQPESPTASPTVARTMPRRGNNARMGRHTGTVSVGFNTVAPERLMETERPVNVRMIAARSHHSSASVTVCMTGVAKFRRAARNGGSNDEPSFVLARRPVHAKTDARVHRRGVLARRVRSSGRRRAILGHDRGDGMRRRESVLLQPGQHHD